MSGPLQVDGRGNYVPEDYYRFVPNTWQGFVSRLRRITRSLRVCARSGTRSASRVRYVEIDLRRAIADSGAGGMQTSRGTFEVE